MYCVIVIYPIQNSGCKYFDFFDETLDKGVFTVLYLHL